MEGQPLLVAQKFTVVSVYYGFDFIAHFHFGFIAADLVLKIDRCRNLIWQLKFEGYRVISVLQRPLKVETDRRKVNNLSGELFLSVSCFISLFAILVLNGLVVSLHV